MKNIRYFTTTSLALQKTLIQKIQTSRPNQNTFSLTESTRIYFNWLFKNTKKNLALYEQEILKTTKLPIGVDLKVSTVAGLHELHLENPQASIKTPTLLVHGHAASGIFFHRNFYSLSSKIKDLYALDLPDVGLSDHKPFETPKLSPVKLDIKKLNESHTVYNIEQDINHNREAVQKVIDYYVSSLEEWRQSNNIEKMNVVAHSFGGHLSFHYCLRYPQNVSKLILVSPAGVERSIFSINNDITSGLVDYNDPTSQNYLRKSLIPNIVAILGFKILKALGPFGIKLISNYLSMRFSRGSKNDEQVKTLMHYTLNLFYQNNNSYPNLRVLLSNQLLARDPILDHVKDLKIPILFMYGQFDWMNGSAGYNASLEAQDGKFEIVEKAGHNVFLDNPSLFDRKVLEYLDENPTVLDDKRQKLN